jgi:hypothetical protein
MLLLLRLTPRAAPEDGRRRLVARRAAALACAALVACGGERASGPPVETHAGVKGASQAPAVPAASASDGGAPDAGLAWPPPEEERRLDAPTPLRDPDALAALSFLGGLCQIGVRGEERAFGMVVDQRFGCTCCAPFQGCPPTGKPEVSNPEEVYAMIQKTAGSFTRPGADELAVTLDGCEPGAQNRGGTVLLERSKAGWAQVAYFSSVMADGPCTAVDRRDRRQLLLCRFTSTNQSYGLERVVMYDLATPDPGAHPEVLFTAANTTWPGCWAQPGAAVEATSVRRLLPSSADHVAFEVSHAHGTVTPAYLDRCKAAQRWDDRRMRARYYRLPFDEPRPVLAALLPAPRTILLDFARGPSGKLAPAPASLKAIADMQTAFGL